jgi:hypothetical protein
VRRLSCEQDHEKNVLGLECWLDCAKQHRRVMINEYKVIETSYFSQPTLVYTSYAVILPAVSASWSASTLLLMISIQLIHNRTVLS